MIILVSILGQGRKEKEEFVPKLPQKLSRRERIEVKPPQKTPTPQVQIFTAKEIVETVISYLDQQKRPDGFYNFFAHYEERCKDPNDRSACPLGKKNMIEPSNMWTILARLAFYQTFSHDPRDLAKAEEDAQALMDFCHLDPRRCMATLISFSKLYAETKKEEYKRFIEKVAQLLLRESYGPDVMSLGNQSRELAWAYELFSDPGYLAMARQRLLEAKATSGTDRLKHGFDDEICYIILAQAEIGRVSADRGMFQEAARFFKEGKERKVPAELTLIQPCIESALILGKLLNDEQIKARGLTLLHEYVSKRWDGPTLERRHQEGGFFMGEDKSLINITDTAYMAYLLGFEPSKLYSFVSKKQ